ncbi:dihydrolipoamide acetyltransferase family protein [Brevibacillus dissolubilis]|uniref:dihydrolipoamide acetyltransferase family protein n=1 Tax=Brevibacillus dissolubilis TaxID=1844116 RepID=UPI001116D6F5|nr:dihydrolipoamide acetyltransferase family protein [Brevibacillus dissolubilis]
MGKYVFKLPELGEGIHEGEIVTWHVKPGDTVTEDQVIVEVQNVKAVMEIPSPVNGKVLEIHMAEGATAIVDQDLVTFEVEGAGQADAAPAAEAPKAEHAVNEGNSLTARAEQVQVETAQTTAAPAAQGTADINDAQTVAADRKVLATPSVRKLARDKGIAISQIKGTGRHGQVTKEDVLNFVPGAAQAEAPAAAPTAQAAETTTAPAAAAPAATKAAPAQATVQLEERVPLKGIRKAIAAAMVKSVYTAPHVTLMDEVDVTRLIELRAKAKPLAEKKGVKLTYLPFIVKALTATVKQFPVLNASIDDEAGEIVYKKYFNIGIATDTDNGLLVPVVTDADRKNMFTIANEIKDLASRGREGKLAPHELRGSTVSITNIGSAGGMFFTPVINHPEVAILGVGRIDQKPVVRDGEIVVGNVMALSLSFDHRIIDGVTAQNALNYIKQLLSDPELFLMEV